MCQAEERRYEEYFSKGAKSGIRLNLNLSQAILCLLLDLKRIKIKGDTQLAIEGLQRTDSVLIKVCYLNSILVFYQQQTL